MRDIPEERWERERKRQLRGEKEKKMADRQKDWFE